MSKGKFEPGKRVLLLGADNGQTAAWAAPFVGTVQVIESYAQEHAEFHKVPTWFLEGVDTKEKGCRRGAWSQPRMILLDPDESPEQSAEAMRDLYSLPKKVTA